MATIQLFDGTSKTMYGLVLREALAELSKYQPVRAAPCPGTVDLEGYNLAKGIEARSIDPLRNQVNLDTLVTHAENSRICRDRDSQKIILIEKDAFAPGLRWAFGQYRRHNGVDYIILSVFRVDGPNHMRDLFAHEIGHMYGAASRGRRNTEWNLGSHCTNDLCVMQQHTGLEEAVRYADLRHSSGAYVYCHQCTDELRR